MTRTIWYVSGTRADYGLMRQTLRAIAMRDNLTLGVLVTGMHLDAAYGMTVTEVEADGFDIVARVPSSEPDATDATMARGIGRMVIGFTNAMERDRPDMLLLLGDRGEMLAGAIAAIHLGIPVVHIHGGERSGTVDEPVRHAVTKLSHYHFAATPGAAERLRRLGERADSIFTVGAPGLVGLTGSATRTRAEMAADAGFDPERPIALLLYHPVTQDAEQGGAIAAAILDALEESYHQIVALRPNSDGGSAAIRAVLDERTGRPGLVVHTHLSREAFVNWMAVADLMVGNSSAGIIEAASFGTPVLNVGNRQKLRERNANVVDVPASPDLIRTVLRTHDFQKLPDRTNIYGDGRSDDRIATLLATLPSDGIGSKCNAY